MQQHLTSYQQLDRSTPNASTVHYVEIGPSILSEVPGIVSLSDLKVKKTKASSLTNPIIM